jgi:plastocyanin
VTWKWDDNDLHSVIPDDGTTPWSDEMSGGPPFPEFSRRFDRSGTYSYHCGIHAGMSGKIIVI